MYLLYPVAYADRPVPADDAQAAWHAAGLGPLPHPGRREPLAPDEVRALVEERLRDAQATPVHDQSGAWEVPDDALPLLKQLEAFYHGVYPETRDRAGPGYFFYEQLEWLGQY